LQLPRAVAEVSDIVFSIVTDLTAVVWRWTRRHRVGLRKDGIYIDMSTIEPDASRASRQIRQGRIDHADGRCPAAWSPSGRPGSVMIGGDAESTSEQNPCSRSARRAPASGATVSPAR
jgi:3-hydroxyisobutyrate dehydrogenase-like beta-hydroxyacid dehydrogenase